METLSRTYYGHLRKALQTCFKGICAQFSEIQRTGLGGPIR